MTRFIYMSSIYAQLNKIKLIINHERLYYSIPVRNHTASLKYYVPLKLSWTNRQDQPNALNDACAICHENVENEQVSWTCANGHACHRQCIATWVATCRAGGRGPTCPTCREEIKDFDDLIYVRSMYTHQKIYNFVDNTVTIKEVTYPIKQESFAEKLEAIQIILKYVRDTATLKDLDALNKLKVYLDNQGIDSAGIQECMTRLKSESSCCIS